MALAPNTRSLGETVRQQAEQQKSTVFPIRLGSSPILDPLRPTPPGVVFSTTGEYGDLSEALDCCGRYTLRNTIHTSSVCVNAAGNMIFALHSRCGGRNYISLGAFDPVGNPVAPSEEDRKVLFNIVPTAEKVLVMDAKSTGGPLGIKYNSQNPRIGVYASYREIIFDLGFTVQGDKWKLDADTTQGLDWKGNSTRQDYRVRGQYGNAHLAGQYERAGAARTEMIEAGYKDDEFTLLGRHKRAGDVTTDMVEAAYTQDRYSVGGSATRSSTGTNSHSLNLGYTEDRFSLGAKHTRSGDDRNTTLNGTVNLGKRAKVSVFYKTREPARQSAPSEVVNVEELSRFGLTFKIDI